MAKIGLLLAILGQYEAISGLRAFTLEFST
nr:MAG TPA: hypothetical protein [Caudoviricetes sp.]